MNNFFLNNSIHEDYKNKWKIPTYAKAKEKKLCTQFGSYCKNVCI